MISRNQLKDVTRIVIKLGTGVITNSDKHPDLPRMVHLASQVNELRRMGKEVVIVSSGAVAAGRHVLGFKSKPTVLIYKINEPLLSLHAVLVITFFDVLLYFDCGEYADSFSDHTLSYCYRRYAYQVRRPFA